ncbi:MAG TPA: lipocalin family protein [Alphaproteobacteria bacterium]|nr:lipocalin family protein [Alphaproteobacteria bacterium]
MATKTFLTLFSTILLAGVLSACALFDSAGPVGNPNVPEPAKAVELNRYLGRWYEIARYENGFEKGCEGVTAEYSLRADGRINVVNTCRDGAPDGPARSAEGVAKIAEGNSDNTKLKVSFFGPFYGDYWVLDRADDYSWAIVGEPSGRYLWLLARDPVLRKSQKAALYARAAELGYDTALLRDVRQPPAENN